MQMTIKADYLWLFAKMQSLSASHNNWGRRRLVISVLFYRVVNIICTRNWEWLSIHELTRPDKRLNMCWVIIETFNYVHRVLHNIKFGSIITGTAIKICSTLLDPLLVRRPIYKVPQEADGRGGWWMVVWCIICLFYAKLHLFLLMHKFALSLSHSLPHVHTTLPLA